MTSLSKKLLVLFLLALVGGGVYAAKQQRSIASVQTLLEAQTQSIAGTYRVFADRHVFPSENSRELTQDQRKASVRVRAAYSKLSEGLSVVERVLAISELQVALISYMNASLSSSASRNSEAAQMLQKELGPQGSVREQLASYNDSARLWNAFQTTPSGALRGQLTGGDGNILPYLRFDGQQEYVSIIEL